MSARRIFDAGYTDLVSVVPPGAELSPTSSLKPSALGKVPGRRKSNGTWVGYNWLAAEPPTVADLERWEKWGANVGLRADMYPALDIDCDDPQLAQFVQQEAQRVLGTAPIRTSKPPRRLLVYRTDKPFGRVAAEIEYRGVVHTVEVLSAGRQYLVAGAHPSGSLYAWDVPLWGTAPEALHPITADAALAFFRHLDDRLSGRATVRVLGSGALAAEDAPPQGSLEAPDLDALRAVVSALPNRYPDRDTYIQVGCAIRAAGGDDALPLYQEWASRWEGGTNDPETVAADWSRMHPPFRVGYNWLREEAETAGAYDAAVEDFAAVPEAVPEAEENAPVDVGTGLIVFSDAWVAAQLVERLKDQIRYVPEAGQFHVWQGAP